MRRSRVVSLTLVIACALAAIGARQAYEDHPNFSGVWQLDEDRSIAQQRGEPVVVSVWASPLHVRHSRGRLVVVLDTEKPVSRSYRLDGQPSVNKVPASEGHRETVSTATWSGDQLVITERPRWPQEDEDQTVRRLTMNPDGTLTIEAPWGDDGAFVASVYARVR